MTTKIPNTHDETKTHSEDHPKRESEEIGSPTYTDDEESEEYDPDRPLPICMSCGALDEAVFREVDGYYTCSQLYCARCGATWTGTIATKAAMNTPLEQRALLPRLQLLQFRHCPKDWDREYLGDDRLRDIKSVRRDIDHDLVESDPARHEQQSTAPNPTQQHETQNTSDTHQGKSAPSLSTDLPPATDTCCHN